MAPYHHFVLTGPALHDHFKQARHTRQLSVKFGAYLPNMIVGVFARKSLGLMPRRQGAQNRIDIALIAKSPRSGVYLRCAEKTSAVSRHPLYRRPPALVPVAAEK